MFPHTFSPSDEFCKEVLPQFQFQEIPTKVSNISKTPILEEEDCVYFDDADGLNEHRKVMHQLFSAPKPKPVLMISSMDLVKKTYILEKFTKYADVVDSPRYGM